MKTLYSMLIAIVALFVFVPLGVAEPVPTWDQQINSPHRFTVLTKFGGAAVFDRETGLVWEKSPTEPPTGPTTKFTWSNAQVHCNDLTTGGRLGWRLPTVQELASLVDPTVSPGPKLPSGHPFFNVQSYNYWSATTSADDTSLAWVVRFFAGDTAHGYKSDNNFVWCVRGGQGVDSQ